MPILPTLSELQAASKERHSASPPKRKRERRKIKKLNPACYLHIGPFIEMLKKVTQVIEMKESPKIDFTKLPQFQKKADPLSEKKIIRYFKEPPVEPDEKKVIVRPPAVYSNTSPYGIADALLRGK